MYRRTWLKSAVFIVGFSLLYGAGFQERINICVADTLKEKEFSNPLPVPPLLEGSVLTDGTRLFSLSVGKGEKSFIPGLKTPTLGYNGSYLGPTIRVRDGEHVRFRIQNNIDERTTVHWHGLHVPAQWDGAPKHLIEPRGSWRPEFMIKQPAATLWYHPHALGLTGEHVYRGLAGLFIIEDDDSDSLDIPKDYGINDFPLVLQDRRFFNDGRFAYVQGMMDVMHGVIGNFMLVNGSHCPNLDVEQNLVRLRILNGSNASIYRISFGDRRSFVQIATDGGFQEYPVPLKNLVLSPGERSEVIVDFSGDSLGSKISLLVDQLAGNSFEAMRFTVNTASSRSFTIPSKLVSINWMSEEQAVKTRLFRLETISARSGMMHRGNRLTINGRNFDPDYINETVRLNDTEIWEIENPSTVMMSLPHSMHLHNVQFQILDRNGRKPPQSEMGRKDTMLVQPGERVRIITRFEDYSGIYMYHCHLLEHEDNGMMGQFEVVE